MASAAMASAAMASASPPAQHHTMASLTAFGDGPLVAVLARVPWASHPAIRAVCPRFDRLLKSRAFHVKRARTGYHEELIVVATGLQNHARVPSCWLLSPKERGAHMRIARMQVARSDACSAVYDGELWVLGGRAQPTGSLNSVEVWNPQTNEWRQGPSMRHKRTGAVAGVVAGCLVVAGGSPCNRIRCHLNSVEAFSHSTGWRSLPDMPYGAANATAVELDGFLYVAGGASPHLQMWNGATWEVIDAPAGSVLNRQQRNGTAPISGTAQRCVRFAQDAASVAHRGKMWRIGGETASVSVYDPIMNQWERGVELPSPRSGLRAVEHCGSIYVFGDGPPLRYADNARRWEAIRGFYNLRDGTYGHVCRSGFLM